LRYKYLIVGGGMVAAAAMRGIREVDADGSIGVIGAEPVGPYKRPPLTKGVWKGDDTDTIWYDNQKLNAGIHLGRSVLTVDTSSRTVLDDHAVEYVYERLLLATGATPKTLPFGDGVNYFRSFQDFQRLRDDVKVGRRFAVIGGGFIGSEIAAALALNGTNVAMIFPGAGIGSHIFPEDISQFLNGYYREKGVEILPQTTVTAIERQTDRFRIGIRNNGASERTLEVDGVVAGIGVEPNVDLAEQAGLDVDNGVVVDEFTRTTVPDIFAAGDVAAFFNPALGKRIRVEHEDNAKTMGRVAGLNMAGRPTRYDHLPFFYSDLFDLGYEAVGELDSRLEIVADWKQPYKEGVVYYLRDERVRGVLLWNVWKQVDAARRLIAEAGPFNLGDLQGRLPEK
jgi:NADPH-dependent 2,4-dienoyl-CoA reductase/sulfur reductase-like enzyme